MTISYAKLFEVRILHTYYSENQSPDFELVPTQKSVQILRNLRLKMRPLNNGLAVYAPISNSDLLLEFPFELTDQIVFSFELKLTNPHFLNFTNLPLDLANNIIYYLTNKNTNSRVVTDFGTDSLLLLCNAAEEFVSDADHIILRPKNFKHIFASPVNNFKFEVDGNPIDDPYTTSIKTEEANEEYDLDLSGISDGRHSLTTDTSTEEIYLSNEVARSSPFGLVEIFHNSDIDSSYRFVNADKEIEAKTYYLTFDQRETIWRYIFSDGIDDVIFDALVFDNDGVKGWLQTKAARGLSQNYQLLTVKVEGKDINLPNPSIHIVVPDESTSAIYSEVYI
ncbi:MAG: hypothetical protein AAFP19_13175 [Bacteroidota bacterium]